MEAFAAMVRGVLPRLDYQASYFGKVVKFDKGRQQVDVVPDDPRMPTMQGVPFRSEPGMTWDIDPNTSPPPTVLISWENGDPSRPYAIGFGTGAHVLKLVLNADQIYLGGEAGAEPAAKGQTLQSYLDTLAAALTTHVHSGVTTGGGVSGRAPALASITPPDVLATNAKVL